MRSYRTNSAKFIFFLLSFGLILTVLSHNNKVGALYDGAKIIDNSVFLNSASMSKEDIQTFLSSRGGGIASRSFVLNCYGSDSKERQWYTTVGAPCDQSMPASHIIYYAAQVYGVSPRVILSTLQKEQSLITSPNPTDWQINQAMGYGCPTSGQCAGSSNFFYQIDSGTWVLRYHYERANGNMNWWSPSSTWTCGTEKNLYKPNLYPGTDTSFYDTNGTYYRTHRIANAATAAFYCYTPHAYNNPQGLYGREPYGTTGLYYSGSYNFVYFFELWFGPTSAPYAFKSSSSATIYYSVDGYKVAVPAMGILQDYGISPESIATISQSTIDSIPAPPPSSGVSQNLGYLIKSISDTDADGASVYIVSVGKKYQIISMDQFNDFGLNSTPITYLPLGYVNGIKSAGQLSNFVQSPNSSVFKVSSGKKEIIFEYDNYIRLNPENKFSIFSYYLVNQISSGSPLVDKDTLVKLQGIESVYLYTNKKYYSITTFDAFECWGFQANLAMPLYRVVDNTYISNILPSGSISGCTQNFNNNLVLLNNNKTNIPQSYGLTVPPAPAQDLNTILAKIPTRPSPMKQYVRSYNDASVWYISGGLKNAVPTYANFVKLGLSSSTIDFIPDSALQQISAGGIKLAPGTLAKSISSGSVYVISSNNRLLYSTSDDFLAYKNAWDEIESYQDSVLNSAYPYNGSQVNKYFYDNILSKTYLIDVNGCYLLNNELFAKYNTTQSQISGQQSYAKDLFTNLNLSSCKQGSEFVKSPTQSTVYQISNGQKGLITKWQTLVNLSGTQNPNISVLAESSLNLFNTGNQLD